MPYFGIPIRNGLPIGLGTLTALAKAVAVVVPPVSSDPYFEYVSLLANTTSTNGAQNNTFLDGSTNAFSITRNGNTTQGTFSPFSQTGWSNYFDGTGDYLTLPTSTNLEMGSGNFTWEFWLYPNSVASSPHVLAQQTAGMTVSFDSLNSNQLIVYDGSVRIIGAIPVNTWTHFALVRSGTTLQGYINGVASGSSWTNSSSTVFTLSSGFVGSRWGGLNNYNGYLTNLRIVKGTAVYTANFTPPTAPLTAITNTSLLTCQSNRFIDNSSNAFAITRNGDVSVQAFSPFNPTAAWSASTNGGSGYFDGTGDYLTLPTSTNLEMGSGNFTWEFWLYPNSVASSSHVLAQQTAGMTVQFDNTNSNQLVVFDGATRIIGAIAVNTWTHVAIVRSGTTLQGYINGVASGSSWTNASATVFTLSNGVISSRWGGSNNYNGYLTDLRIVKGTAVYTANFTPPTAPLTAITNTSLLLNFTNAGIYDSASGNDLETVGNAQVSTVQAKWGTTSMAFDGTGDWLTALDRPALRFGTAPFTIEGWVYYTAITNRSLLGKGTLTTGWDVSIDSSGDLVFSYAASTISGAFITVPSATWTHFAIVRTGTGTNQTNIYINGVLANQGTVATNFSGTDVLYIGASRTATQPLTGYIDDLRITNGYARYTANFTPPTAAFPLN